MQGHHRPALQEATQQCTCDEHVHAEACWWGLLMLLLKQQGNKPAARPDWLLKRS
jgi:hypothetical protein